MASCIKPIWTVEETEILKRVYADTPNKEIAKMVNKTTKQIASKACLMHIHKSDAYLLSHGYEMTPDGISTKFRKGFIPYTKGKKQTDYISPEKMVNVRKTFFKKGVHSVRYMPDGSERIDTAGYRCVKVNNKWRLKHHLVWEEHNGPIPDGHTVCFKNGNIQDIRIDNLFLASRADILQGNTVQRYPVEMKRLFRAQKKLERLIKKTEDEQQD